MTNEKSTNNPFDDIRDLINSMPALDGDAREENSDNSVSLGRGLRPVGRLKYPLSRISNWQGSPLPSLMRPLIAVFAGTHGVAEHLGYGDIVEASKRRVTSLTEGQAAVRGVAGELGSAFKVYEFGLDYPSADFTLEDSGWKWLLRARTLSFWARRD